MALRFGSYALTLPFAVAVWSDDDWLKKFSGKTLEENTEEGGAEAPKAEVQEVGKTTGAICILAVPKAESVGPPVSGGRAEECHLNLLFFFSCPGRASCQEIPGQPSGLHGHQDWKQTCGAAADPPALRCGAHDRR